MMSPLILDPAFSVLAVLAADMVCIATVVALATACAIYALEFVCSFSVFTSVSD